MKRETVTLTNEELKRVKVMELVKHKSMTMKEASETLGLTKRQARRILAKYIREGEKGITHAARGRRSPRALSEDIKAKVVKLYDEKYSDSNFTHFSELLEEREKIKLSLSSVGRILKSAGKESKKALKRRPKKHRPRERRAQEGMLWQTDATPYAWLGKEIGTFVLHAMIDDATGIVVSAVFTRNECAKGYSDAMQGGIEKYAVPLASLYR
jgi:transposase